ncbi:hypothetical protein DFH27DRAFT_656738 [Peziza echinospora]|nr:hypothetical protein DFH27DRAFT_656738 [Peziza echinospora]
MRNNPPLRKPLTFITMSIPATRCFSQVTTTSPSLLSGWKVSGKCHYFTTSAKLSLALQQHVSASSAPGAGTAVGMARKQYGLMVMFYTAPVSR